MFAKVPEVKWVSALQTASGSEPMYQISLIALSLLKKWCFRTRAALRCGSCVWVFFFVVHRAGLTFATSPCLHQKVTVAVAGPPIFLRVRRGGDGQTTHARVSQQPCRSRPAPMLTSANTNLQTSLPSFRHVRPCILQIKK